MRFTNITLLMLLVVFPLYLQASREDKISKTKAIESSYSSCNNALIAARDQRKQCNSLIGQCNNSTVRSKKNEVLQEAIKKCKEAIELYTDILKAIDGKRHNSPSTAWRTDMKKSCEREKTETNEQLAALEISLSHLNAVEQIDTRLNSCREIQQKADKCKEGIVRGIGNVQEVVSALNETTRLYDLALAEANAALSFCFDDQSRNICQQRLNQIKAAADDCRKDAATWSNVVKKKKEEMFSEIVRLEAEGDLLEKQGKYRSCYEIQENIASIMSALVKSGEAQWQDRLNECHEKLKVLAAAVDTYRQKGVDPRSSEEDFKNRENERRTIFYHQMPVTNEITDTVTPLDGQKGVLYTNQFYRYLVQRNEFPNHLCVRVLQEGKEIHHEVIPIPQEGRGWEQYLTFDVMLAAPHTVLSTFGLDLRLSLFYDPYHNFSLIIAHQGSDSQYAFAFSLDDTPLYDIHLTPAVPWQLDALNKPTSEKAAFVEVHKLVAETTSVESAIQVTSQPVLDEFVKQLNKDPIAIAQYVYNEIELRDPICHREEGVFLPPLICRSPLRTFLEKQGSAWELCMLLADLLTRAGYRAQYLEGTFTLASPFVENLLSVQLPGEKAVKLRYPGVVLVEEKQLLFPWMKEMTVKEGYDVYSILPAEYGNAERWLKHYLCNDENIHKHIGPDGDDTAGKLFVRFLEEHLRAQGLSLHDVGIHRTLQKRHFHDWNDFPNPETVQNLRIMPASSFADEMFGRINIKITSEQDSRKQFATGWMRLVDLSCSSFGVFFHSINNINDQLHFCNADKWNLPHKILLGDNDRDFKIEVFRLVEHKNLAQVDEFSIIRGTHAALCYQFGGTGEAVTSFYAEKFTEKKESEKLHALCSLTGAAYFEKCAKADKALAALHKVSPMSVFAVGLAKLSPDHPFSNDLRFPQVDMHMHHFSPISDTLPSRSYSGYSYATQQYRILSIADISSNEHQVLREVYRDKYAISTVKLLQIAHQEHQCKGLSGAGFLTLTRESMAQAEADSSLATSLYFSHLGQIDLQKIKQITQSQWNVARDIFSQKGGQYVCAYMTPGTVSSQDGHWLPSPSYTGIGTIYYSLDRLGALISNGTKMMQGGYGSRLQQNFLELVGKGELQVVSNGGTYSCLQSNAIPLFNGVSHQQLPGISLNESPKNLLAYSSLGNSRLTTSLMADVRHEHKSPLDMVADPVDIVTGAFYIDETDLTLVGPFSLEIRRNYNSQNPVPSCLGEGWKLSLNPYLIEEEDKLYAAEQDGTTIVYRQDQDRWVVCPEDNPDLRNHNSSGIGSTANPFHAYIEKKDGYILHGSDGSKRIFHDNCLKTWSDSAGNTLTFSYEGEHLKRIENMTGGFLCFEYNPGSKISEVFASDGRRISYTYDSAGNLAAVKLPNDAVITYEYDSAHRIIRESKPHGRVLENVYEDDKVIEQRSPVGFQQQIVTSATFTYADDVTKVTDARGGCTEYKIYQKHIYKITDPEGHETLQSWFLNRHSYFDAQTEQVQQWDRPGGYPRSLKSSTDKRGLTTSYLYDNQGNVEEVTLTGEDLTGKGDTSVSKRFSYNANHLCIQEETLNRKTLTIYDSTYTYLPKRIEQYSNDILTSFVDLEYHVHGMVNRKNESGAITEYAYDKRDFPIKKIQKTGSEDPDVITNYRYNNQGQCIEVVTADSIQHHEYDIMGNCFRSTTSLPSGKIVSQTCAGYDLNNALIWKQGDDPNDTLYLDYNAAGLVKAARKSLSKMQNDSIVPAGTAYTLYEYDACGNLIEQVDSLGHCTYHEYDSLGRILRTTKGGLTTSFTYEAGGFVESMISPNNAITSRRYTSSGQLYYESQPDGSAVIHIYDLFGRPIEETKYGVGTSISYNDAARVEIRTRGNATTIYQVDARGNLITYTDPAGYVWTKTYDSLNRIKTETDPNGEITRWNYKDNTVTCRMPNGETCVKCYAAGAVEETHTFDCNGTLIAESRQITDFTQSKTLEISGNTVTATWVNTQGRPIRIQQGDVTTTHHYDSEGNCVAKVDGDGHTTLQEFDALGRLIRKQLPDGAEILYDYDADSHLISTYMPGNLIWKATYDSMGHKLAEWQEKDGQRFQYWDYKYQNGLLTQLKDPMGRHHQYVYDSNERLLQEVVDSYSRDYAYDPRGFLASVVEKGKETTRIDREYDGGGRLIKEAIFLNGQTVQLTEQQWTSSGRMLRIGDHQRDFIHQNGQLKSLTTAHFTLYYDYAVNGSLIKKTTPYSNVTIQYNASALPKTIDHHLPDGSHRANLMWTSSGKLLSHETTYREPQTYQYTSRGFIHTHGEQIYTFDFALPGRGVRTSAPNHTVVDHDVFGRIVKETIGPMDVLITYNEMGQVTAYGDKQLEWDPWGRLIAVTCDEYSWTATYDALGRRLQTVYVTNQGNPIVTLSYFDPEHEFQEIGIVKEGKTLWKLYGPTSCDALIGADGDTAVLHHDVCNHLIAVTTPQTTYWNKGDLTPYGPRGPPEEPKDRVSYALALNWHSTSADPTGLIWLGARYYNPASGRFLSPDPISFPFCLDLYAYANGDPVNNIDPDGRFASYAYKEIKSTAIATATYLGVKQRETNTAMTYVVGKYSLQDKGIFYTNGMNTPLKDALKASNKLSEYAGDHHVHLIYNDTYSVLSDTRRWFESCKNGVKTGVVTTLDRKLDGFFARASPNATALLVGFSEGVTNIRNFLQSYDADKRQRIEVIVYCPSTTIDGSLCKKVRHYCSERDIVHILVGEDIRRGKENIVFLPRHPKAPFIDHAAVSPTFEKVLTKDIYEYLNR